MFTTGHLIYLAICAVAVAGGVWYCAVNRPPLRRVLVICLALSLISELIKVLYLIQVVPVVEPIVEGGQLIYRETGAFTPYLEAEHLPLELCSYQMVFMFLALIIKDRNLLRPLYALMFPTCVIGGAMALFLTSEMQDLTTLAEYFTSVSLWRTFLYHAMLITLGIYIGISDECGLRFRDIRWTIVLLLCLDFGTLYLNSVMSTPYYKGDTLMGIGNAVNYFSSYNNPLGIVMADKASWLKYLAIRITLALTMTTMIYLPLMRKERKAAADND